MKKQILSTLTWLALCLSLLPGTAWAAPRDIHLASGNSITQLDPAPTTPTDDPFPTLQSFVYFMYYGDAVPLVGNALTGATGDEASFAWDTKQNGHYGTITLNADGTYSYRLDNDNYTVETLQFGQTLTEEFTYTYTDSNGGAADGSINIYLPGTGRKVSNPQLVVRPDAYTSISSGSTQPATGNVFDGLRDLYPDFQGNASNDHNFAWDADQEATFGTITLESNGDYSYTLNNDHPHVKALPYINALGPGQNLTEEFEFKFTKTGEIITDEPSEVGDVISGWLIVTIGAGGESAGDEP